MSTEPAEKGLMWMGIGVAVFGFGMILLSRTVFPSRAEPVPTPVTAPIPHQHKAQYLSAAFEAYELRLLASFENGQYPVDVDESRERLVDAIGTFCTP